MTTNLRPQLQLFEPLLANANATITIRSVRSWDVDPITGNTTANNTVQFDYRAVLRQPITARSSGRMMLEQFPGIDEKNNVLFGFIVDPKSLPEGVDHNTEAFLSLDQINLVASPRTGRCRLWIPPQNPFVKGDLGIKLLVEMVEDK